MQAERLEEVRRVAMAWEPAGCAITTVVGNDALDVVFLVGETREGWIVVRHNFTTGESSNLPEVHAQKAGAVAAAETMRDAALTAGGGA